MKKLLKNRMIKNIFRTFVFWVVYLLLFFVVERRFEPMIATKMAVIYYVVECTLGWIESKRGKGKNHADKDGEEGEGKR